MSHQEDSMATFEPLSCSDNLNKISGKQLFKSFATGADIFLMQVPLPIPSKKTCKNTSLYKNSKNK